MKISVPPAQTDCSGYSLETLLELWQNQPYAAEAHPNSLPELIQTNPALEMVLGMSPCLSWIIDLRTQKFVLVSNNCEYLLGCKASYLRKSGLAYLNHLMHPEDKKNIWRQTAEEWHQLVALPVNKRQNYSFNRRYRLRHTNGVYLTFLEQNSVLQTDTAGNITHLISILSDITSLGKAEEIGTEKRKNAGQKVEIKSLYAKTKKADRISKREQQIIKMVAEGLSSKIIADTLFISYHTVNTHRRNIREKTHSRNTSGVVQFAILNSII